MAQLPDPATGAGTIAGRQFRELEVRFLQQKRRARCRAAAPDERGFENGRRNARFRKGMRHQSSGHAATDNSDRSVVLARQRRISWLDSCGVRKPQGSSGAQPRACTAVARGFSHSAWGSGLSAGPEITSPVGLKRDP